MDRHDEHNGPGFEAGRDDESTNAHATTASGPRDVTETRRFQSVEELVGDASVEELRTYEIGKPPVAGDGAEVDRRDFMKVLSATFAAASLTSACGRLPERYVLPYSQKPEELTPGRASYYATTCKACSAGCGVLMKSRDGRPIKVEGNPEHPLSQGGVCAMGQASVLGVYDGDRFKKPTLAGKDATWKDLDAEAGKALAAFKSDGSKFAVLSKRVTGPATAAVHAGFLAQFPRARAVAYEPAEISAIAAAHGMTHGRAIVPGLMIDKAELIVSFGADFLGTWLQPVAFMKQWSRTRKLTADRKTMSKLVVVETRMSLTGSNADERLRVLPSEERALVLGLADRIGRGTGFGTAIAAPATDKGALLDAWAKALVEQRGRSLVLSGSSDVAVQAAVNVINEQLGNYGKTLDVNTPMQAGGDQAALDKLLDDVKSGAVTGLLLIDVNPAYDAVRSAEWAEAIKKTPATIAISQRPDETAQLCKIVAAAHHPYEAWGDGEPQLGLLNVQQPLVRPLFETRAVEDTLLAWSGNPLTMMAFMQQHWQKAVLPRATGKFAEFQTFWDKTVQDGFATLSRQTVASIGLPVRAGGPSVAQAPQAPAQDAAPAAAPVAGLAAAVTAAALPDAASPVAAAPLPTEATPVAAPVQLVSAPPTRFDASGVQKALQTAAPKAGGQGAYELVLYPTIALGDGTHANNPFLQELPDPITKATWGNYVLISPKTAAKIGVGTHDVVKVSAGPVAVELPVVLAPGLHDGAIALPLGYGRKGAGRIGNDVGANAYPFAALGGLVKVDVSKTGAVDTVAFSQTHHSYEHRDIVKETTLAEWQKDAKAGNEEPLDPILRDPHPTGFAGAQGRQTRSLWDRHKFPTYRWGMAIDLNACTGCGACVIACNVENNIPVVGKREVTVRRELHWLRIDRYFSERKEVKGYDWEPTEDDLLALADNPEVVHQPMLCQHCENAPCETVCPVLATVHTTEGLNAQVYNRCIGTRYCANNCPYKVRRFNWFNYPHGDLKDKQDLDLVALALNPDVVKRSRGVMEKCSFCVQRIQDAKADAVHEGRDGLRDGDVQTACQQTCPADAITFGNLNDDGAAVRKLYEDPRNFSVIPEVGTGPVVSYMTKVRNATRAGAHESPADKGADKAEG
jgi:Fe-S-cluster-containing dehydrogenase component/anaerobic selenocysteine-containing dehydrogenase